MVFAFLLYDDKNIVLWFYSLSLVFLSNIYIFIELSVAFPNHLCGLENHKALWRLSKFWLITISALIYF